MKICPTCRSTYTDPSLSFCLQDGAKLKVFTDDVTQMETVVLEEATRESVKIADKVKAPEKVSGDRKDDRKWLGKILSSLAILLVGVILGIAPYFFLTPGAEPAKPDLTTPPVGPDFKTFEEARRLVDADPAKYISANAVTPHDAVDYYLLGRAYLVTGNYTEARGKFSEARKRSQEIPEINRKSILNEIAMAMVILDNPIAQNALTKEISTNTLSSSNTNSNSRANANR